MGLGSITPAQKLKQQLAAWVLQSSPIKNGWVTPSVSKNVDFFIFGDDILIFEKKAFESVLNYKQAHADDFEALQAENEFSVLFFHNRFIGRVCWRK
jgi:hypothetical protein